MSAPPADGDGEDPQEGKIYDGKIQSVEKDLIKGTTLRGHYIEFKAISMKNGKIAKEDIPAEGVKKNAKVRVKAIRKEGRDGLWYSMIDVDQTIPAQPADDKSGQPGSSKLRTLGNPQDATNADDDKKKDQADARPADKLVVEPATSIATLKPTTSIERASDKDFIVTGHIDVKSVSGQATIHRDLVANHFQVDLSGVEDLYLYPANIVHARLNDEFQTSGPSIRKRKRIFALLLSKLGGVAGMPQGIAIASDYQTTLVTSLPLQFEGYQLPVDVSLPYYDEDKFQPTHHPVYFTVRISAARTIRFGRYRDSINGLTDTQLDPAESQLINTHGTEALSIVCTQLANQSATRMYENPPSIVVGGSQKFYPLPSQSFPYTTKIVNIGRGLAGLQGFYRSVQFRNNQPFQLNINPTISAFVNWDVSLAHVLEQRFGNVVRSADNKPWKWWRDVEGFIKGLRVITTYKSKVKIHTLDGLAQAEVTPDRVYNEQGRPRPHQIQIAMRDDQGKATDRMQSVHAHFQNDHHKTLQDNELVVRSGTGNPVYLPTEYINVLPGHRWNQIVESLAPHGKVSPTTAKALILGEGLETFGLQTGLQAQFGVRLAGGPSLMTVPSTTVDIPVIQYRNYETNPSDLTTWRLGGPKMDPAQCQARAIEGSPRWSFIEFYDADAHEDFQAQLYNSNNSTNQHAGGGGGRNRGHGGSGGGFQGGQPARPPFINPPRWSHAQYDTFIYRLNTALANFFNFNLRQNKRDYYNMANDGIWHRVALPKNTNGDSMVNAAADIRDISLALQEKMTDATTANVQLWIILLPTNDANLYNTIKDVSDRQLAKPTVCFIKKEPKPQMMSNLCLKINLKLSNRSVNHRLVASPWLRHDARTMVVGIDVAHAGAGSNAPSVAAMVANTDHDFAQWPASMRLNPRLQADERIVKEDITEIGDMLTERLDAWLAANAGTLPERIIIYRDGLSDSQLHMCKNEEFNQRMLPAIDTKYGDKPKPHIMLICCVKRHHTRFYAGDDADIEDITKFQDEDGNPAIGTVIYDGVTGGDDQDFFLVSQNAMSEKGKYDRRTREKQPDWHVTLRPTHYLVLYNNRMDIPINYVAKTTLDLCFMYGRATMPVGVVTPAKYADLACGRARKYLLQHSRTHSDPTNAQLQPLVVPPLWNNQQRMFYI